MEINTSIVNDEGFILGIKDKIPYEANSAILTVMKNNNKTIRLVYTLDHRLIFSSIRYNHNNYQFCSLFNPDTNMIVISSIDNGNIHILEQYRPAINNDYDNARIIRDRNGRTVNGYYEYPDDRKKILLRYISPVPGIKTVLKEGYYYFTDETDQHFAVQIYDPDTFDLIPIESVKREEGVEYSIEPI